MGLHEVDSLYQAHVPDVSVGLTSRLLCLFFPELPGLIPGKWMELWQKNVTWHTAIIFPIYHQKWGSICQSTSLIFSQIIDLGPFKNKTRLSFCNIIVQSLPLGWVLMATHQHTVYDLKHLWKKKCFLCVVRWSSQRWSVFPTFLFHSSFSWIMEGVLLVLSNEISPAKTHCLWSPLFYALGRW